MKSMLKLALAAGLFSLPVTAMGQAGVTFKTMEADRVTTHHLTVEQLRSKYADRASRYLKIDGLDVHYKDEGKGPVLLLVHGSVSTMRTWDEIASRLKSRYRVIRFDLPGFGLSGPIPDDMVGKMHATDVPLRLLQHLGVAKVDLAAGVSSGGTMAALLAAKHPGLVDRLVLSNMPADPVRTGHLPPSASMDAATEQAKRDGYKSLNYWNEYLSYWSDDPARISAKVRQEYYDFNRRMPEKHPISYIAQVGDGSESTPLFGSLRIPVLLAWGSADPLLPKAAAERLAGMLKQADLSKVYMPDVSHYPPVEVPERFADIMDTYLQSVAPNLASE